MNSLHDSPLHKVKKIIEQHCLKVQRNPSSVKLVAVSKTQPLEKIQTLIEQGQIHFAENYVQEALGKIQHFQNQPPILDWHFIGHLQTNKAKDVVGKFNLIHSVDSLELAKKLDQQTESRCEANAVQNILLQVHLGEEPTKSGFAEDALLSAYEEILNYKHILVIGLMTMPPLQNEAEQNRPHFRTLKSHLSKLRETPHPKAKNMIELSMGTSHDFHIAVEEGASIVRIGTTLFGPRL